MNATTHHVTLLTLTFASRTSTTVANAYVRQNDLPKAVLSYQLAFSAQSIERRAAAETLCTIAADPKHLGARIGMTAVLHTWGSALTHHPHVHCIVPGGGLSLDNQGWVSCRPGFFLPVRVLSRLFRRLFLEKLSAAREAGQLRFYGALTGLSEPDAFAAWLAPQTMTQGIANRRAATPSSGAGFSTAAQSACHIRA